MKVFSVFLICAPIWAQVLQILPSPPSGSQSGSFRVMLVAPAQDGMAALQWRISVPQGVSIAGGIEAGDAARQAGKSVTCAAPGGKAGADVICVAAGGRQAIPNGTMAVVRFTAGADVGIVTVRLSEILGATPDAKAVKFPNAEASIPLKDKHGI